MLSLSSISANIASKLENVISKNNNDNDKNESLFDFSGKGEDALTELDAGFDTFVPSAAKYVQSKWSETERAAGNGLYDNDAKQGQIGDCGLLSTLRALRNSESGQKALSEVMSYDAANGSWSFTFKTKDFAKPAEGENRQQLSPIVVTKAEVDAAIEAKGVSKGDDDVSATELAVKKYLEMIGRDTENNTKDKTVKSLVDMQNRARDKRAAAGMDSTETLDGITPYMAYLFTGQLPKNMKLYEADSKQKAQEFLANFDSKTDLLVFSQINAAGVENSGGDTGFTMIGDDQILQNHAYTVCDVDGNNVTLRESNNPAATIVVTMDELLNCAGKNSFYATELPEIKEAVVGQHSGELAAA